MDIVVKLWADAAASATQLSTCGIDVQMTDMLAGHAAAEIVALRKRVEDLKGAANDEREWLKKQVFALCEDTTEKYHDAGQRDTEGKEGAFARGRCIEAKSIARAIGDVCHERAALRAKGGGNVDA